MNNREKQIEEMAKTIDESHWRIEQDFTGCHINDIEIAERLYEQGCRKQSEGKWEKFEGEHFICSNCAKVFGLGSTATIYDVKRVWKYCPNCGAKMDGSKE